MTTSNGCVLAAPRCHGRRARRAQAVGDRPVDHCVAVIIQPARPEGVTGVERASGDRPGMRIDGGTVGAAPHGPGVVRPEFACCGGALPATTLGPSGAADATTRGRHRTRSASASLIHPWGSLAPAWRPGVLGPGGTVGSIGAPYRRCGARAGEVRAPTTAPGLPPRPDGTTIIDQPDSRLERRCAALQRRVARHQRRRGFRRNVAQAFIVLRGETGLMNLDREADASRAEREVAKCRYPAERSGRKLAQFPASDDRICPLVSATSYAATRTAPTKFSTATL